MQLEMTAAAGTRAIVALGELCQILIPEGAESWVLASATLIKSLIKLLHQGADGATGETRWPEPT